MGIVATTLEIVRKEGFAAFFRGSVARILVVAPQVCCSLLQFVAVWCSVVQWAVVRCSVLQVCCSVLRCVAVCCSMLQHGPHPSVGFAGVLGNDMM